MAAYASGMERLPGSWEWVDPPAPEPAADSTPQPQTTQPPRSSPPPKAEQPKPKKERHYRPRTCRICFDTVLPTFHAPSDSLPGVFQGQPNVTYWSEEGGRLISPCKCKGSSRYVHEACLQEWRHADPSYGKRNYWNCPTCGFRYRLGRISWAHYVSSAATQITLTVVIFMLCVFALGFIADPIINLYLDPLGTVSSLPTAATSSSSSYSFGNGAFDSKYYFDEDDIPDGWPEHFIKGLASLGLLGFVKVLFTMGPWNWFNMRQFMGAGRAGTTGRDRVANVSWLVVVLGVCTFLYTEAVWKAVRAWSRRVLEKASERVMDVQGDGDDEDDDDADTG